MIDSMRRYYEFFLVTMVEFLLSTKIKKLMDNLLIT